MCKHSHADVDVVDIDEVDANDVDDGPVSGVEDLVVCEPSCRL